MEERPKRSGKTIGTILREPRGGGKPQKERNSCLLRLIIPLRSSPLLRPLAAILSQIDGQ